MDDSKRYSSAVQHWRQDDEATVLKAPSPSSVVNTVLIEALDGLRRGVVLLSRKGAIQFVNATGRRMLDAESPPDVSGDRLRLHSTALQARLDRFLLAEDETDKILALRLPIANGSTVTLLLNRMTPGRYGAVGFLGFLFDEDTAPARDPTLLREFYALTACEAEVAGRLYNGLALKEISEDLGVSIHTVRAHLKHIFKKCGVHSQAELVRLLALGPYWG